MVIQTRVVFVIRNMTGVSVSHLRMVSSLKAL